MPSIFYLIVGAAIVYCGGNAVVQSHRFLKYAKVGRWFDHIVLAAGIVTVLAGIYVTSLVAV